MMKRFLALAFLALASFATPQAANAVCASTTCFFIGTVNSNLNQIGNWSDTSGGLTNGSTPSTGDRLCYDSAGNVAATINASVSIASINTAGTCTGGSGSPHTAGITHSAGVTITNTGNDAGANGGTTHLVSSSTPWTASNATTSLLSFTATSGTSTISQNSSGASRNTGNVTINGAGGTFVLGSALIAAAGSTVTYTAGTDFQLAGFGLSMGIFDVSATNVRILTCSTSTTTHTGTAGTIITTTVSANLTINCSSATHVISSTPVGVRNLGFGTGGTKNWGAIQITNALSGSLDSFRVLMNGTMSAASLTTTNVKFLQFTSGQTYTFTGAITHDGTASVPALFISDGGATATISVGSNSALTYVYVQNITKSGGAGTLSATTGGCDGGNNSGWGAISGCGGGSGGGRIIGG